jgi:hypothetical protein
VQGLRVQSKVYLARFYLYMDVFVCRKAQRIWGETIILLFDESLYVELSSAGAQVDNNGRRKD